MSKTPIKPGTDNQKPGYYVEVGPRGGKVTNGHTATIGKGDRLPPTSAKGNGWKKVQSSFAYNRSMVVRFFHRQKHIPKILI